VAAQGNPVLGGYELLARVAAGGMATLYVAQKRDAEGEPLAVKVIHAHLAEDWEVTRYFIDEALIAIRLKHPNVVRVDELGEVDGTYFLAMEYVHGCTLADLLGLAQRRGHRLDPRLVAWIGAQVCRGLHGAHELRGDEGEALDVVHRDMSPQNVLLGHDGQVKVIDFGVAKAGGRARRTSHGEMRGKLRYMAPEQVTGDPLDRRVDLFSLGVMLWEALAMRRLHPDLETTELLEALKHPAIPPVETLRDDVPKGLAEAIAWATQPSATARPRDAAQLGALLDDAAGSVGQADLAALVRELAGPQLAERARGFPEAVAARFAGPSAAAAPVTDAEAPAPPQPISSRPPRTRSSRPPAKDPATRGLLLFGVVALLFFAAFAVAAYFLL